jgi:Tat protein secretion system quality control protein TatD with DNase activity
VPHVARALAEAKDVPLAEVAAATTHNFELLFAIPPVATRSDSHEKLV